MQGLRQDCSLSILVTSDRILNALSWLCICKGTNSNNMDKFWLFFFYFHKFFFFLVYRIIYSFNIRLHNNSFSASPTSLHCVDRTSPPKGPTILLFFHRNTLKTPNVAPFKQCTLQAYPILKVVLQFNDECVRVRVSQRCVLYPRGYFWG